MNPPTPTSPPLTRSLAFTVDEYRRRAASVQRHMAQRDLDVLLATTMAGVCWLTGIESVSPHKLWAVAVPRDGEPKLFCQDFEGHNARLSSWLEPAATYGVEHSPLHSLVDLLTRMGAAKGRIGLESAYCWSSLSIETYDQLRSELPEARFIHAGDCVSQAMAVKSAAEIIKLRQAGAITVTAMQSAIGAIRDGMTDNDIAAVASSSLLTGGSEYASYPVIVTTGRRSSIPHSTFHRAPIARGDAVFIEIAAAIERYQTPMMRVASLGEPPSQLRDLATAAVASVNTLLQSIKPGVPAHVPADAAAKCLQHLSSDIVWHGIYGYSVGVGFPPEWSDCPTLLIRKDETTVLEPGMVLHCSTSLRDVGNVGATCSETVLITETGCESLTGQQRSFTVVD